MRCCNPGGPGWAMRVGTVAWAMLAVPVVTAGRASAEDQFQYEFGEIRIPAASADEPIRDKLSVSAAVKYLDHGARAWNGARGCVSCHTNGTWMLVRPALSEALGPPPGAMRQPIVEAFKSLERTPSEVLHKAIRPAQVIYVAAGLAEWDRHVAGRLSDETADALKLMFSIQLPSGTWGSLDCWPPYESDAYHLATVAAMGVAAAPGWLDGLNDAGLLEQAERLKNYLRTTEPPHDYGRLLLLWTETRMPGLLSEQRKQDLIERVWQHQREDGGWSIRTFAEPEAWGRGNRAGKLRGEPEFADPPSDGHLTGLAVVVLRQAGIPADDARIERGVSWLQRNQRESGRWWTRSLNTERWHFITYSGTAFPLWALALCDALPEEQEHWSLRPRVRPDVPAFASPADRGWIRTPIDAFVLDRLRQRGLRPAPEADRLTLIRRLAFDLTGLPPTPEEVARFLNDDSPGAWERLVDRYLASPQYGERWGQHWLDVVRFAESEGFEYDRHVPGVWRFRDYVVESFNADKPFDRFLLEQLAGDELAGDELVGDELVGDELAGGEMAGGDLGSDDLGGDESRAGARDGGNQGVEDRLTERERRELQIAAGFHRLGPVRRNAGNPEVALSRNEVLTERTDIIGSAILGLTVACARCHDHFFDPIPQRDYYRLQAFLAATQEYDVPLADDATLARWQSRTERLTAEIDRLKMEVDQAAGDPERRNRLEQEIRELEGRLPEPPPTIASIRNVADERTPIHILARGEPDLPGEPVGMQVLNELLPAGATELPADTDRPKTLLARWLIEPSHPLTARVLANRIWLAHFGEGLVDTPNDFGLNGNPPSHPELLDWLSEELASGGWRLKRLHRLILTSSTWRQSSRSPLETLGREIDPDNRLLWRFNRRRLAAEEVRDAVLAASGRLNLKMGGPSVLLPADPESVGLLYAPSQWQVTADESEHARRSIYLMAKRNLRLPLLEVFDQPDLLTSCARRESSTHAPQALELLNGSFSNDCAEHLAARLLREAGNDRAAQVELGFRLTTGRPPSPEQQQAAVNFLADYPLREFALALFNVNGFVYVD